MNPIYKQEFTRINQRFLRLRLAEAQAEVTLSQLLNQHAESVLRRSVQVGLQEPTTQTNAVDLLLALYAEIERRGYGAVWRTLYQTALTIDLPSHVTFRLLIRTGQLERAQRRNQQALERHRTAFELATEYADQQHIVDALTNISADLYELHRYAEAAQQGQLALKAASAEGMEPKLLASVLHILGRSALAQADVQQAVDWLTQAVYQLRLANDPQNLARGLNTLAVAHQHAKAYKAATRCYDEALQLLSVEQNKLDYVMTLNSKGSLLFATKQLTAAEGAFAEAYAVAVFPPTMPYYVAMLLANLANVLLTLEQFDSALEKISQSIEMWQRVEDKLMLAHALGIHGEVLLALGRQQVAHEAFEQGIQLLSTFAMNANAQKWLSDFKTLQARCR